MLTNESGIVDDYDNDVTVVTVATDAPDNFVPLPAMIHQEKQGGRCCGICCDYRRAVIILGIISIITGILNFLMRNVTSYTNGLDDDELRQELYDLQEEYILPNLILDVLFILFGIIAVIGGVRFSAKVVRTKFAFFGTVLLSLSLPPTVFFFLSYAHTILLFLLLYIFPDWHCRGLRYHFPICGNRPRGSGYEQCSCDSRKA